MQLSEILKKEREDQDLVSILTRVNRDVQIHLTKTNTIPGPLVQVPTVNHNLTRKVFFTKEDGNASTTEEHKLEDGSTFKQA